MNMLELGIFRKAYFNLDSNLTVFHSGLMNTVDSNTEFNMNGNKISEYILRVFCGTHGDYGAQSSHIIFPVKIFLERAYSSVNVRGICYSYRVAAYKYFVDDIKTYPELLKLKALRLDQGSYACKNYYSKDPDNVWYKNVNLYNYISRVSPLFSLTDSSNALTYSRVLETTTNYCQNKIKYFRIFTIRNRLFDFFLSDHYSRASVTLNTHYSKSFYFSDFKFMYSF